ncbi:Endonuclease/exonuclease/phosphatase, partial [Pilobolus umbonatus]
MNNIHYANTNTPGGNSSNELNNTKQKNSKIIVASLNCRSLTKTSQPQVSNDFVRHLRTQNIDILCLQETYASSPDTHFTLNRQFRSEQSIWTTHVGIVSLNPLITISPIFITRDQRVVACEIEHKQQLFDNFLLINIYAPAQRPTRQLFFEYLLNLPIFRLDVSTNPDTIGINNQDNMEKMIVGDFNYNSSPSTRPNLNSPQYNWKSLMDTHYVDCLAEHLSSPTFRRGTTCSSIDYFFASQGIATNKYNSSINFINPTWTDHALILVAFRFQSRNTGKGIWRVNPNFARDPRFLDRLHNQITKVCRTAPCSTPPHVLWEQIKKITTDTAQKIGRRKAAWRKLQLERLNIKRDKIFEKHAENHLLAVQRASIVETHIANLQQEIVDNDRLRAQHYW